MPTLCCAGKAASDRYATSPVMPLQVLEAGRLVAAARQHALYRRLFDHEPASSPPSAVARRPSAGQSHHQGALGRVEHDDRFHPYDGRV